MREHAAGAANLDFARVSGIVAPAALSTERRVINRCGHFGRFLIMAILA